MKKIIVIGGTGMLGKPVLEILAKNNFNVVVLSRKEIVNDNSLPNLEYVQGDVQNPQILNSILKDAYGVHINLSGEAEEKVGLVIESAKKNNVQLITYISGITVNKQNINFKPTQIKYNNEQQIVSSGINYVIFKPTWFLESLPLFVNNGRASYFGKQKTLIPFVASSDYVKMVLNAYNSQLDWNKSYEVIGKSLLSFQDALTHYVDLHHQSIKGVSSTPYFIGNIIATLTGNKLLKDTVAFMKYFERATIGNYSLPKLQGETTFKQWLEKK
jgi:uncharacterized protein YbjT (DUF2867 family)